MGRIGDAGELAVGGGRELRDLPEGRDDRRDIALGIALDLGRVAVDVGDRGEALRGVIGEGVEGGAGERVDGPQVAAVASKGATPLLVCEGNRLAGLIVLEDILKPGMSERFERLRRMGVRTVTVPPRRAESRGLPTSKPASSSRSMSSCVWRTEFSRMRSTPISSIRSYPAVAA